MIITDISAQNILKYETLEIKDLPESGVIAIDGPNESGKSTIGETICFALFGRSFSLGHDELVKMIRWGEMQCSVSLSFKASDGSHYQIARFLDREGNSGVRLNLAGNEDQPIARGTEDVENALYEILGYGYDEFIESFYLAQREITTPHPHSYAVKAMAGLSTLEYVAYEFSEERGQEQDAIDVLEDEAGSIDDELETLGLEEGKLASLEDERDLLVEGGVVLQGEIEALETSSSNYQEAIAKIASASSARGRAKFFRFIFLLIAVAFGAAWGLLTQLPEHQYTQMLLERLQQFPQWDPQFVPYLLYGVAAAAVLFILSWIRVAMLNSRIRNLKKAGVDLADKLNQLHQSVPVAPSQVRAIPDSDEEAEEVEETEGEERFGITEIAAVCERIEAAQASAAEVSDVVGRELAWMSREGQQQQDRIAQIEQDIWSEQDRLRKAEKLNEVKAGLEQKIATHQRNIHMRELADELLAGATGHLSQKFNRDLRDLVSRTLPMFTEGRYEHLQIDDDLTVRVFSSEKRDFMDLEEISSGTQRQIMLAVRLALSQELVNSTVDGKQFIFLDEPFAFFDKERTLSALKVLPNLSDEITQVWIVAQEYPQELQFDLPVSCDLKQENLALVRDQRVVSI